MACLLLSASRMRLGSVCGLGVLLFSCQPETAASLQPNPSLGFVVPGFAQPAGARPTTAASARVQFDTDREAIAPLSMQSLSFDARPGAVQSRELPVAFSTRGVWARVTAPPQQLTVNARRQGVSSQTLVYFPVSARRLSFVAEVSGEVVLEPVATVDTVGGGFEVEPNAAVEREVTGSSRITDPQQRPDDTFAKLVQVEATAPNATRLSVGACGPSGDAPSVTSGLLEVSPGQPASATMWLGRGDLCLAADQPVRVKVTPLGRVRRFATSSLRAVVPLTVLDTQAGVAFEGLPLSDQELRVPFTGLQGEGGATHRLLSVSLGGRDVALRAGPCSASVLPSVRGNGLVLLPAGEALCVKSSASIHVEARLIGLVTPRSEAVECTDARAPEAACSASELLGKLNCIQGMTASVFTSQRPRPGVSQYLLHFTQPVDHQAPEGATFSQRMILSVRDPQAPMVIHTTGYELFDYQSDLASNFPTNELEVEHRFFESSTPAPVDYSALTIMQSAADSHRIVEALGALFPGKWVNTGHSKGGMTALYHRRFFPCDVKGSAPYVTPLSFGKQDARFGPWLASLGGPAYASCRQVTQELEGGVMARKDDLALGLRGTYTLIGSRTNALWAAMSGSALWGMFQMGAQDDPMRGCPAYVAIGNDPDFPSYIEQYAGYAESYADESFEGQALDGYSYQTQNELGSPGGNRAHLEQYGPIPQLTDDGALLFGATPLPEFEPRAMQDIQRWLKTSGERFVFIYGGFDPWSAAQLDIEGTREAMKVMVPGQHHGVGLQDLAGTQRDEAFSLLEQWLEVGRSPKRAESELRANRPLQYRDVMHRHRL